MPDHTKHHRRIVSFFKDVRDQTSAFSDMMLNDRSEWRLLDCLIDSGDKYVKPECLRKEYNVSQSKLTRTKDSLNLILVRLFNVTPPIQLYFKTLGRRSSGGHFACCDMPKDGEDSMQRGYYTISKNFVNWRQLDEMLNQAFVRVREAYPKPKNREDQAVLDRTFDSSEALSVVEEWESTSSSDGQQYQNAIEKIVRSGRCPDEQGRQSMFDEPLYSLVL